MAHPQTPEQRIDALRYGVGAQFPRLWNGACQQADAADQDKFAPMPHREGKAEHAAHILDADHLGRKNIWNANRIYKVEFQRQPSRLPPAEYAGCGTRRPESTVKSEGFAVNRFCSLGYPSISSGMINNSASLISDMAHIGAAS